MFINQLNLLNAMELFQVLNLLNILIYQHCTFFKLGSVTCCNYHPQMKFGARLYFQKHVSRILSTEGCRGGGLLCRGAWSWGICSGGAWWTHPPTATAAGSMHPTGMHSCCTILLVPDLLGYNVKTIHHESTEVIDGTVLQLEHLLHILNAFLGSL